MRSLILTLATILLALGVVEGMAHWWMHPAAAGSGEPVLVYQPRFGGQETGSVDQGEALAHNSPSNQKSATNNQQSSISPPSPILTPLPEIYAKSAPMLRCSSGRVLHAKLDESAGIHLAFFEWDGTDAGSVLEAFRHMPEACMGSIGMTLVEKAPLRTFVVRGRETGARGQGTETGTRQEVTVQNSSPKQTSAIDQQPSSISPASLHSQSSIPDQSLVFDHTIFREGGGIAGLGPPIHAFRAVWVSGISTADARKGLGGDSFDRLRTIRLKSARDRFRPAHARVIQGAVRGIPDPDLAWAAFEGAMLRDLSFQ